MIKLFRNTIYFIRIIIIAIVFIAVGMVWVYGLRFSAVAQVFYVLTVFVLCCLFFAIPLLILSFLDDVLYYMEVYKMSFKRALKTTISVQIEILKKKFYKKK